MRGDLNAVMKRILAILKHEFLKMLPPTIYFFVVFHIIAFARNLLAEGWGVSPASTVLATIGALIIGKSILIVDALPLFHQLGRKRLIYDIAARTILYVIIALVLQFLEEFVPLVAKHEGVAEAAKHVIREINWPQFWVGHLFMVVFLLLYTTITGVSRVIGHGKVLAVLLSPIPDSADGSAEK